MSEDVNIPAAPKFDTAEIGKRCLVTGGAGYVGRTLVRRLREAGCEVRSFDVMKHSHGEGVEPLAGDLRDFDTLCAACEGVDTIFHTAALINLLSLYRPAERRQVYEVNVVGTENLLRAARAARVTALVHTSTFNVALDGEEIDKDESLPYARHPRDLYSLTKIAAEQRTLAADNQDGLRVCALRPGGVWGSDTGSLMIRSFLTQLAAGNFKALVGDPKAVMENSHVENLGDAHLLAARALREKPALVGGEAYFITDGEPINQMEWFRPLCEGLGYRFPTMWLPARLMLGVAWAMEAAHFLGGPLPTLTVRGVRNLAESSSLRIAKAQRDLGYEPRHTRANSIPQIIPLAREFIARQKAAA